VERRVEDGGLGAIVLERRGDLAGALEGVADDG